MDMAKLIGELKDKDWNMRHKAAEILGQMKDTAAVEALIPLLKDTNRFVRQEGAMALGRIGGVASGQALTRALEEEKNEFVTGSINKALEKLRG